MAWRFELQCPRCAKVSETVADKKDPPPIVNCGDCLMDHVVVVEMHVTGAKEIKP